MKKLSLIVFMVLFFLRSSVFAQSSNPWLLQLQKINIDEIISSDYKFVVLDYSRDGTDAFRFREYEISRLKKKGITPICYISIGEAEDYRWYWKNISGNEIFLDKENKNWPGNYKVKYWEKEWQDVILKYLDTIISQGFEGVYLDIIDAYEYWKNKGVDDSAEKMIDFVVLISNYAKEKSGNEKFLVIPQNAENIIDFDRDKKYINAISGIGIEDLWYNETRKNPSREIDYRLSYILRYKNAGKLVVVTDYVDDRRKDNKISNKTQDRIEKFEDLCKEYGFNYYPARSDRALDVLNFFSKER
ncbi:endo alpha-1,4 polygalactosaminidase [bacterium]|nr:endo alpha-1,4 polygalactosaminidase [bacterium]